MFKIIRKSLLSGIVLSIGLSSVLLAENNPSLTISETQNAEWDDGFCKDVTVINSSGSDIDWIIDLPIEGEITGMWSATYTQDSDTLVATIEGEGWANLARANSEANFSYCASKVEVPAVPNEEGDLLVTQTINSEWDGGFCVDVDIQNTKSFDIDWEIKLTSEGPITGLWDAQYTFDATTLEATVSSNSGWNDIVGADGNVNFNYCASEVVENISDENTQSGVVTNYTVNPIKVDQFGYLPTATKVAVISNPIEGFNAGESFNASSNYELRRVSDNSMAWNDGIVVSWKDGQTHTKSGDKVWHYDFTAFEDEGEYYVYDVDNNQSSNPFKIAKTVYNEVLKQSVRMLFLQRSNFAKVAPYVKAPYIDAKAFPQDEIATSALDKTNTATQKDVSGGWFDAGDYNKYMNYTDEVVHDLLIAYKSNPVVWGDNYNIPESGNGVPDILDELRYELDWILKMQLNTNDVSGSNPAFTLADKGSFLHKVSAVHFGQGNDSPPSSNADPRYYGLPTVSATISAVGMLAHASIVYASIDSNYAETLKTAAIEGWNYLDGKAYSNYTKSNSGFLTPAAEDSASTQKANKVVSSIYLYALTNDINYKNYYESNAVDGRLINHTDLNDKDKAYFNSGGTSLRSHDAQLLYATLAGASTTYANAIHENYTFAQTNKWVDFAPIKEYDNESNPYLSFLDAYPWGSNQAIGSSGNMLMNMVNYEIDSVNSDKYKKVATGYLHYLHGLNPQNLVYLSNMNEYGAENSVDKMHHAWFTDGIAAAPGFLVGGAVDNYHGDAKIHGADVSVQPALKAYASDYDSYEMSEPQLMYQSAYIRLLSSIMGNYGAKSVSASIDVKIANGDDDVEEVDADWMYFDSSDLELIEDSSKQIVGLRFVNLEIPKGASISNAYIQFTTDEVSSDVSTILEITAQNISDAPVFTWVASSISNRAKTASSVSWDVPLWSVVHESSEKQRTPNLKDIVQEVVNRDGWEPNNAMVFMIDGTGKRTAESYDGSSANAPRLYVEYSY